MYSAIRQGQSLFLDIYTFCYGLSKNTVNDMLMELINKGVVQTRTKCLKDKAGGRIEVTYQLTRTTQ